MNKKLSKIAYEVTQLSELKSLFQENIVIFLKMEPTFVCVVTVNFLIHQKNLSHLAVGQAFLIK